MGPGGFDGYQAVDQIFNNELRVSFSRISVTSSTRQAKAHPTVFIEVHDSARVQFLSRVRAIRTKRKNLGFPPFHSSEQTLRRKYVPSGDVEESYALCICYPHI